MKNLIYLFFTLLFFTSCTEQVNDHHLQNSATHLDSIANLRDAKKNLQHVHYNCDVDIKQTPYHGTLKASVSWEDKKGKNVLIIAERPQYFWQDENKAIGKYCEDPDDDTEVAELFAWHYVFNEQENKWKILWALNDFQFACCDVELKYTPYTLHISDLDSNGIAESIFSYAYSLSDGPIDNFWQGKLMLHLDTVKYSIKGSIGRQEIGTENKPEYSSNFNQLSPALKDYASQMWKRSDAIKDSIWNVEYMSTHTNF